MLTQKFFLIASFGHELTLWLLLILSILSLAVAMERFFFLKKWKKSAQSAQKEMQQAVESGHLEWIKNLNNKFTYSKTDPGTSLISSYLDREPDLIVNVFQSFVLSKKNLFESHLNILASIGSNAPFIGLLGTIFGVMDAFYALGLSSQASNSIVMMGISKALLATAVGLIVAIPSILFYNFLRRQVQTILHHFECIKQGYLLYNQSKLKHKPKTQKEEIRL